MADMLTYTLSLQDKISSKLNQIGIGSDSAREKFSKLQVKSNELTSNVKNLGNNLYTLKQRLDLLKQERELIPSSNLKDIKKYNAEINRLQRSIDKLETVDGSKMKTSFQDVFNSLPAFVTNPVVLIGAAVGGAIRKGMEADMQKANILTLVKGNADKAKKLYADISDYGIKTPYEKGDLIEAQKTMMSFGLAADSSFGILKNIGDIALGDAQKMQSLSLAFAQATSAGKLQGQDLNQMINAGFNPLQIISERTGESMVSLKEKMSKGQIGADQLAQAFKWATDEQGLFYKGAEKASEELGGKWSNILDALSELMLKLYDILAPILLPTFEFLIIVITGIGDTIGWVMDKLSEGEPVVSAIAIAIGALTTGFLIYKGALALVSLFQTKLTWAVIKTNLAFLANPITWIILAIVALIGVIAYLILGVDGWGKAWQATVRTAQLAFMLFGQNIQLIWLNVKSAFLDGLDVIKKGWYNLMKLWDEDGANKGLEAIKKQSDKRQEELKKQKKIVNETKLEFLKARKEIGAALSFKSFGEVKNKVAGALGIPGDPNSPEQDPKGTSSTNQDKTNNSIATGGTKQTTIYLNLRNLVENLNIKGNDFKESALKMEEETADALLRVLALANTAG